MISVNGGKDQDLGKTEDPTLIRNPEEIQTSEINDVNDEFETSFEKGNKIFQQLIEKNQTYLTNIDNAAETIVPLDIVKSSESLANICNIKSTQSLANIGGNVVSENNELGLYIESGPNNFIGKQNHTTDNETKDQHIQNNQAINMDCQSLNLQNMNSSQVNSVKHIYEGPYVTHNVTPFQSYHQSKVLSLENKKTRIPTNPIAKLDLDDQLICPESNREKTVRDNLTDDQVIEEFQTSHDREQPRAPMNMQITFLSDVGASTASIHYDHNIRHRTEISQSDEQPKLGEFDSARITDKTEFVVPNKKITNSSSLPNLFDSEEQRD